MARITQAAKIEQENEEQALVFFEQQLAQLPDPQQALSSAGAALSAAFRGRHCADGHDLRKR